VTGIWKTQKGRRKKGEGERNKWSMEGTFLNVCEVCVLLN